MKRLANKVREHPFIKHRPVVRQFIKFSMVGVVNTTTSVSVYLLMTRLAGHDPLVANAIAFVFAVTVSFILNKYWTFRDKHRAYIKQYSRFFIVSVIGFIISETIIFIMHKQMGFHDLIAFFTAVTLAVFWNFSANRWWTFRSQQ